MNLKTLLLFIFQAIAHVGLVWGVFNFEWSDWLVIVGIYFLTGCIGVSVTLHRFHSHRSFKFKYDWVERIGSFLSVWGMIGSPLSWVNNHRAHHRYADKPGDPHSPQIWGVIRVQWFSMFFTHQKLEFVSKMIRDPYHRWLHRYYYHIHLIILLSLLSLGGIWLTVLVYLAPAAILWNAGSMINTVCHSNQGYINHEVNDSSKNNLLLGYLVWGEGWHNNHHWRPASKTFKIKSWEFDMSYQIIRVLEQ